MIVKEVAMRSARKSNFAGLINYLTGKQSKDERVGDISAINCYSDQAEVAVLEILNTQAQNTRAASDKTRHLIVSFRAGEQPSPAVLKTIESRICEGLGFGEHQRISVVHRDTDNLHFHIAINKIHPRSHTIHTPYYSQKKLSKLCGELERELRLETDNHRARKQPAENRADDMEHQAGIESLLGWIKRECYGQMLAAQSWPELHQVMANNGLELHERGNGLVLTAGDGTTIKASSLGREFSKNQLEKRLGDFESAPERLAKEQSARHYEQKPVPSRINTSGLFSRYQEEQRITSTRRAEAWGKARDRKDELVDSAKLNGRRKRALLKLFKGARLGKTIIHGAINKSLKNTLEEIHRQYQRERQEIYDQYRHRSWVDWLRIKAAAGDLECLTALRARVIGQNLKGNTVSGKERKQLRNHYYPDSITKKGTVIYRFGATAVRDDGDRLNISRELDREGIRAAMLMAWERFGESINVSGTAAFKEQIAQAAVALRLPVTFDDPVLEKRRRELGGHGAAPDNKVAPKYPGAEAASRYISEREEKRRRGIDVPKHVQFDSSQGGPALYAGLRQVEGQTLALLKRGEEFVVLPVDTSTAYQLKHLSVGEPITVSPLGVIKTQGRSR